MHNSRDLAFRDPATAALVGVIAGADFGQDFGDDFGDDFGADAPGNQPVAAPTQAQALALWHKTKSAEARVANRVHALDPNKDSPIKVEGFIFTLDEVRVWGTAAIGNQLQGQPATTFRPQRLCSNVPMQGIAVLRSIQVSNVNAIVGPGSVDEWCFAPTSVDVRMSLPTLSPAHRVQILSDWTGLMPAVFVPAAAFTHTLSFFGPAKISG
jgi:hypothetical protein